MRSLFQERLLDLTKKLDLLSLNKKTIKESNPDFQIGNEKVDLIINEKSLNFIAHKNQFILKLNESLNKDGYYISYAETYAVRKKRLLNKYPKPLNWAYYSSDFVLTRISPKLKYTKNWYHKLSKGKGNVLSKTEILGRFYFLGFQLIFEETYKGKWIFVFQKIDTYNVIPEYKEQSGFLIKLPRIGKNGKIIQVFKFRTMHPYAEFIQEYVHQKNDLQEGGKLKDDFRISTIGKFLRKYWLDEMPMILNILKGEMKLIGVRPLSAHYMSLYSEELQQLRTKSKPGLLPPFYADNPKTLEEIQESEKRYILAHQKNPMLTDFQYFIKILNNILLKGKRSA